MAKIVESVNLHPLCLKKWVFMIKNILAKIITSHNISWHNFNTVILSYQLGIYLSKYAQGLTLCNLPQFTRMGGSNGRYYLMSSAMLVKAIPNWGVTCFCSPVQVPLSVKLPPHMSASYSLTGMHTSPSELFWTSKH